MTLRIILTLLPTFLTGLCLILWIMPLRRFIDLFMALVLSAAFGLGIDTLLYFGWSVLFGPANPNFGWVEWALALSLVALTVAGGRKAWTKTSFHRSLDWTACGVVLTLSFAAICVLTALLFYRASLSSPHGTFDAYAIWNLRARFVFLNPAHWLDGFSPAMYWKAHPDYPLLIPFSVLRLWESIGKMANYVPILVALFFSSGLSVMLYIGLRRFSSPGQAAVGGLVMLGSPIIYKVGMAQTADIPVTFYIFCACLLVYIAEQDDRPKYLILAGLSAGLAAWTKNEGLMFAVAASVGLLLFNLRRLKRVAPFFIGLAVPLLVVVAFKTQLAPPSDLLQGQTLASLLQKVTDGGRYATILEGYARYLWTLGGWKIPVLLVLAAYYVVLRRKLSTSESRSLALLLSISGLTLLGYAAVYLITPHPLEWHIQYSLDRLVFHTFPTVLFCVLIAVRTPEDVLFALWPRRAQPDVKTDQII